MTPLPGQPELPASIHGMFRRETRANAGNRLVNRHGRCSPKAEATGSNPVGCANNSIAYEQRAAPLSRGCLGYVWATAKCCQSVRYSFRARSSLTEINRLNAQEDKTV